MKEPLAFYKDRKNKYEQDRKKLSGKLAVSSILRLLVFLALCAAIYFFYDQVQIVIPAVIGCLALFIFLISRHSGLKREKDKMEALISINETEIHVLETGDFLNLPEGKEFDVEDHDFSRDIDLFGRKSFFQYLNRTALAEGASKLSSFLLSNDTTRITEKQEAIKELANKADWRQEFSATATLVRTENSSKTILKWIANYKAFVPSVMRWLPLVFTTISVGVILAYYFSFIGFYQLLLWLLIGIMITAIYVGRINQLSSAIGKIQDTFQQYYQLLGFIEDEKFESVILLDLQTSIASEKRKASEILKEFSKGIDALDQRNNFLFGFLANGFMLWDLKQSYRLEKWILQHRTEVSNWFKAVENFDAYNSLGNFAFNQQQYTFPKISEVPTGIEAKELGHPLLKQTKRVDNDFRIESDQFFIITGANMAGKSTFLRTVALQIVMSNMGLPVCANSCTYSPIKLISSMRTSDSLGDDESYFFSELKRLKYIVDKIQTEKYFIILDEILKGTNSTDKAIGSKKFIERLVKSNSTGIIATHDLSLCETANQFEQVKNYYFDAEIENNELHFDYRFKKGICQNMNASFLLRKMQIVED